MHFPQVPSTQVPVVIDASGSLGLKSSEHPQQITLLSYSRRLVVVFLRQPLFVTIQFIEC